VDVASLAVVTLQYQVSVTKTVTKSYSAS